MADGFNVIISAGGLGTRLRSVVSDLPKPMAPIGERPFLHHLLDYVCRFNVKQIVLAIGYMHEVIEQSCGDSWQGVPIRYAIEDTPLGSGGGILNAFTVLGESSALILHGDTFFEAPLNDFVAQAQTRTEGMVLALTHVDAADRYGLVRCDDAGVVTEFREKQHGSSGWINSGSYFVQADCLQPWLNTFNHEQSLSLETEIQPKLVQKRQIAGIYYPDRYFVDIGVPEDYEKADRHFAQSKIT